MHTTVQRCILKKWFRLRVGNVFNRRSDQVFFFGGPEHFELVISQIQYTDPVG